MTDEMTPEQMQAVRQAQATATSLKAAYRPLDEYHLDLLFREARSHNGWTDEPVSEELLEELYAIARMGPSSLNTCPARYVFVTTDVGKERIKPALFERNVAKVMTAPVVVIFAYDLTFYEHMHKLVPYREVRSRFEGNPELIQNTAFRNATLQSAWFMLVARALGLDCGPMSGFNNQAIDTEFFAGTRIKSNFICGLGHGDPGKLFQRLPRFEFDEACQIV